MGYSNAGFDVIGVDHKPQPHYPFEFVQMDSLLFMDSFFQQYNFDVIHASPPCQMFSAYRRTHSHRTDEDYVNLIPETRDALRLRGLPYVIENVPDAPLEDPIQLCGSSFGLYVRRHRLFEANWALEGIPCDHSWWTPQWPSSSNRAINSRLSVEIGSNRVKTTIQRSAMQIPWMTRAELSQAIPPAYTHFIGVQLRALLESS